VAGTSTGAIKHVVKLSTEERERLQALISSGKRSAQLITKARILLEADASEAGEGWTDREIAAALDAKHQHRRWRTATMGRGRVRGDAGAQI
jgi:hypothetical protein